MLQTSIYIGFVLSVLVSHFQNCSVVSTADSTLSFQVEIETNGNASLLPSSLQFPPVQNPNQELIISDILSQVNQIAVNLLEKKRASEAHHLFERSLDISPGQHVIFYNMGIALKELGRLKESLHAYEKSLLIKDNFREAHYNSGRTYQILADDIGPEGFYRDFEKRKQALQKAAFHFRQSGIRGDSYRSLEEVLHQLGEEAAAREACTFY